MVRQSKKRAAAINVGMMTADTSIYNAGIYRRLSSDDKKKRGDSLETQQNIIENYIAASPDVRLVEIYTDNITRQAPTLNAPAFRKCSPILSAVKLTVSS